MRVLRILLLLALAASLCSIGRPSTVYWSSRNLSEELALAVTRNDRHRALELVAPILEDEAAGTCIFDDDTRWNAANAIRDLGLTEMAPTLRKVAGRSFHLTPADRGPDPVKSCGDMGQVFAIKSALSGLTWLRDPEAVALNRLHIFTPVVSSTAFRNLQRLEDWEATTQVRRALLERDATRDAFLDLAAAFAFLTASPLAQPEDCMLLKRLAESYSPCFEADVHPPGISGCEEFVSDARRLEARFDCGAIK